MRILVGTYEIGRFIYDLADGLEALGHEVDTALVARNPQHPDLDYDYLFDQNTCFNRTIELQNNPLPTFLTAPSELRLIRSLLTHYDLYIFQFAHSIFPGNQDLPILKQLGKKIICIYSGSDIRHWSSAEPVAESYGYKIPSMYRSDPYANLDVRTRNLRMGERYADAVISVPFQSEAALRPYYDHKIPVNLSLYTCNIPDRRIPVLVHAPSRRGFKGTQRFLDALHRLEEEGVEFELRLLEGVPNQTVIRGLNEADVVLDQLNSPHYAMLALEGMATGCAVVGGAHPRYTPFHADAPVWHTTRDTVYERLKQLLTDRSLRTRLAEEGRSYVEAHHDHVHVASKVLSTLTRKDFDYYPTFYANEYQIPDGYSIDESNRKLSTEIVQRWGLPESTTPTSLIDRGLIEDDFLDPVRPILNYPPIHTGIREEIWGWSPSLCTAEAPNIEEPARCLIHSVLQALQSMETREDHSSFVGKTVDYCNQHPCALDNTNVTTAIARLAIEVNQPKLAISMLKNTLERDKSHAEARRVLAVLLGGTDE